MIITILAMLLMISIVGNAILLLGVRELEAKAKAKPKAIEAPKAICDCEHPLSMHDTIDGCAAKLIRVQGQLMKNSYTCPCKKYIGPVPMTQYFDDQLKELR